MQLILVRHANVTQEPALDAAEWQLSDHGRARAARFAPRLRPFHPTRFLTSSEPKAVATGEIMAAALDLPCATAPGLHEHDRHGMGYLAGEDAFRTAVTRLFAEPERLVLGRETAVAARTRFTHAIHAALAAWPADTLAIVTHGTVLALFLAHHNPALDALALWQELTLPCAFVLQRPSFAIVARLMMT